MPEVFSNYNQVLQFLDEIPMFQSVGNQAADFNLERFADALNVMGDPQNKFKSIHVAGTNGKGSTCRLLSYVLQTDAQKTGLFTSPHLVDYRERVQVEGQWVEKEAILRFFNIYCDVIKQFGLTYFEISTALAFWYFAEREVDWAVIEVGLGGRLDATNVIRPEVSVITSIGMDHSDILGDNLADIAKEKAGIIKENVPVVIGDLPTEALDVVCNIAESRKASCIKADQPKLLDSISEANSIAKINKTEWRFNQLQIPLIQLMNWSIVIRVIDLISDQLTRQSLELLQQAWNELTPSNVFRACMERLHPDYPWYFDGGHNPEAIHTLLQSVDRMNEHMGDSKEQKPIFVIAAMKDKVNEKSFGQFAPYPNLFYYTLNQSRAAHLTALQTILPQIQPFPEQYEAQINWLGKMRDQLVIFVGSFYFYKTVRDLIKH